MLTIADLARAPQRVFPTHARVERYYPAAAAEEARGILGRCLDRGEGPALLIGSPGTGKSMLLEVLSDDLGKNRPVVCLTSAQLCTRRALLQSILFELGQSYRQRDEGDLRLALIDYLSTSDARRAGVLMLVDEAQALPIRLLEELRVLGNIAHQGVPTVRLLLAGSQGLEETFTEPEVEAFNQRIVARCYLAPLSHYDTAQFIRGHLAAAGAAPDQVFTADALDAVYRATDGIARLVNQVCDRALWIAAGHGQLQVTKQTVQGAWADLQQLPTPWNLPDTPEQQFSRDDDSEQVVEFGPLSEDGDASVVDHRGAAHDEATPAARMYQPEAEAEADWAHDDESAVCNKTDDCCESASCEQTKAAAEPCHQPAHAQSIAVSSDSPSFPQDDDLFGGQFEEEEVLIDNYASLEQAIPASRPRVTSSCDGELGQMLQQVMDTAQAAEGETSTKTVPLSPTPASDELANRYAGLTLVDESTDELDELPIEPTELDEESDEFLGELNAMVAETSMAATSETRLEQNNQLDWSDEDLDILVIEDEMSLPIHGAAAHRADYRQLFKTLRND